MMKPNLQKEQGKAPYTVSGANSEAIPDPIPLLACEIANRQSSPVSLTADTYSDHWQSPELGGNC